MTDEEFAICNEFISNNFGITMGKSKRHILEIKMKKLMEMHQAKTIREYLKMLENKNNRKLVIEFLNEITVNKTNFFREINHFNFLKNKINAILEKNQRILKNKEIRVWSSACSTGEEPYTLAIILKEILPSDVNIRILATDISHEALNKAIKGEYKANIAAEIPPYYLQQYFKKNHKSNSYEVSKEIKKLVTFRAFNLKEHFIFKNSFDIIFCRNVMIYFDLKFQEQLINKFYHVTHNGGLLFIGHSESLSQIKHRYKYVKPTIYSKI